jgi:hypothetical protein
VSATFEGRRRPDLRFGELHDDLQPGDYWKILDRTTGEPLLARWPGKLTETCWHVVVPMAPAPYDEQGYAIGNLQRHTVREHDDGTISVRRDDGSSNSILVTGHHDRRWHGYIEHGVFEEIP